MHPFEEPSADLPPGVSAHLDARMKPGWRFDRRRCVLVSETGQSISLKSLLPKGAKVVPTVPSLADAELERLSEDERLLARCVQVVLPMVSGATAIDADKLAAQLRSLDGLESVSRPPRLGLP